MSEKPPSVSEMPPSVRRRSGAGGHRRRVSGSASPARIEVYRSGQWLCTAVQEDEATQDEIDAYVAANEAVAERHRLDARAAKKRARRRYTTIVDELGPMETTQVGAAGGASTSRSKAKRKHRDRALKNLTT